MLTRMVHELKSGIGESHGMRRFMPALTMFLVFLGSIPAFGLSNGWPVPSGTITSTIGWRMDPFGSGKIKWHNGIDIAVPLYTPVTPTGPGMVRFAGWHKEYGWLVVVDHHNGWFTMYGHNYTLAVKAGQEVTPETVISYAGSTGKSTGVHVHFERRWFPEGATAAPAAATTDNLQGYSDNGNRQPQLPSGHPDEELQQSTQAPELLPEETGEAGLNGYNLESPGGIGGE
jgi:murein DD-endopeptidase MepM/ murein hydrolase activator NlpD